MVVKLKTPLTLEAGDGKPARVVEELSFRRARMGDLKGLDVSEKIPWSSVMMLASRLSGEPIGVIERLDEGDVGEVTALVLGFYARCLGTGETP